MTPPAPARRRASAPAPGHRRRPPRPPRSARHPAAAVASLAAAALLLAPAAAAQAPSGSDARQAATEGPGPALEAAAFAGVLTPLARLTADPQSFETEVSTSLLVGAEAAWWPRRRLGVAAQGAWAPARLSLVPTDFTGALPGELGGAEYVAGSVEVRYRLGMPPEVSTVRPYLALGGGIRRLDVDPIASPEVTDATDPMATAAAGARVRLGSRLDLRVEVRDRITVYGSPTGADDRLQNDMGVSVGLGLGSR